MTEHRIKTGEKAVAIVKLHPAIKAHRFDIVNYTHPGIKEIIPAWKTTDGKYFAVATGEEVNPGNNFQERTVNRGTEFRYPDGTEIILIRDPYTKEEYFALKINLKGGPCYKTDPFNKEKLEWRSTML